MNSLKISFLLTLAAAVLCSAHIGGKVPSQEVSQTYCGRTLARALALLCFDDTSNNKRSDTGYGMPNAVFAPPYYKEQDMMQMDLPWISPYKARSMNTQRNKRQLIVSECCDKPCSINELLTYC